MNHAGRALVDPFQIFDKIGLTTGMRVADMGCGRTGHFVFPASRIVGATGVVYAVDILKEVLESINSWVRSEALENVHTVWSDIETVNKTPIPEKSLDACFFMNVLHGLKNKDTALTEASRLLKDEGVVAVIEWQKRLGALGPEDAGMLASDQLKAVASGVGLRQIESFPISDYHYCSIFKKQIL